MGAEGETLLVRARRPGADGNRFVGRIVDSGVGADRD